MNLTYYSFTKYAYNNVVKLINFIVKYTYILVVLQYDRPPSLAIFFFVHNDFISLNLKMAHPLQ